MNHELPCVMLMRCATSEQGTIGRLCLNAQTIAFSMELPDRGNRPNVSRIPAGMYRCIWHRSPRFGWVYLVRDVPTRSHILIHPGNFAGDAQRGFITHSHGCILLGSRLGNLKGQLAVLNSIPKVRDFCNRLQNKPFELEIVDERSFVPE